MGKSGDVLLTAILGELQAIRKLLEPVTLNAKVQIEGNAISNHILGTLQGGHGAEGMPSTLSVLESLDGGKNQATGAYPKEWDNPENVKPITLWTFDPEAADSWYMENGRHMVRTPDGVRPATGAEVAAINEPDPTRSKRRR